MRRRPVVLILLVVVAAMALAFATSSHWRADRFRERIQAALQDSLQRPVSISGPVGYNLLSGPGFVVEDVTIADSPEFGTEPLAYVTRLEGRLSLASLLTRNWQFSSLRLSAPSLNLAQDAHGRWNIQPLLEKKRSSVIPIEVREARVNFRGDNQKKSPFYITNARADVSVSEGASPTVYLRFEGQPARTDKGEQGFGQFSGAGQWHDNALALDLQLERSAISELVTLTQGQSYGVQGFLASKVHCSGPLHNLQVAGEVQLAEVSRWALLPQLSNPRFAIGGKIDVPGQRVELQTTAPAGSVQPIAFQVRGADVTRQARWAATVTLHELPLASMLPVAKKLGQGVPDALQMQGVLTGVIGYSASGLQGQVEAKDVSVQISRSEPFLAKQALLLLTGPSVVLQPVELTSQSKRTIQLAAEYKTTMPALAIKVKGDAMPVTDLQTALDSLGVRGAPVLRQCTGGTWSGTAEYVVDGTPAGKWIGDGVLTATSIALPGATEPLQLQRADVRMDGDRLVVTNMAGKLGPLTVEGDYRYEPGDARPHQLAIQVPEANAGDIERMFVPANPKPKGFLARTLRFGEEASPTRATQPRQAEGSLHFGVLHVGPIELEDAQSRVTLDQGVLELPAFTARVQGAAVSGSLRADLRGDVPGYRLRARTQKMRWQGGVWDIDGELEAAGIGPGLLTELSASGKFEGKGGDVVPDLRVRSVNGQFQYPQKKGEPSIKVSGLQVAAGRDVYRGEGTVVWPGKLEASLTSGRQQKLALSGSVSPWQVQAANGSSLARRKER